MPIDQSKIRAAREAGYSDNEIASYLGEKFGLQDKIQSAFNDGYSASEIINYLAPPQTEPPQQKANLFSDAGKLLKTGTDVAAQDVRELVGKIPVIGEPIQSGIDWIDEKTHGGKSSDELLKDDVNAMQAGLSKPMQEAISKKWWDQEKGSFGDAWKDPRAYMAGVLQSLPEEALMIFPAMRLARGAYAAKEAAAIAEGLSSEQAAIAASKAAATTAQIAGTAIEGLLGGAQSSRQVRDQILDKTKVTDDMLNQSEAYQSLVAQGMDAGQARETLADNQATRAFVTAGVATGLFGGMGDRLLARIITGTGAGFGKRAALGALSEGVVEELPQSYLQQVAQNEAVRGANPNQSLTDDALNQGLQGMATGALQGGGMAAAFGHTNVVKHQDPAETANRILSTPETGDLSSDLDRVIAKTEAEVSAPVESINASELIAPTPVQEAPQSIQIPEPSSPPSQPIQEAQNEDSIIPPAPLNAQPDSSTTGTVADVLPAQPGNMPRPTVAGTGTDLVGGGMAATGAEPGGVSAGELVQPAARGRSETVVPLWMQHERDGAGFNLDDNPIDAEILNLRRIAAISNRQGLGFDVVGMASDKLKGSGRLQEVLQPTQVNQNTVQIENTKEEIAGKGKTKEVDTGQGRAVLQGPPNITTPVQSEPVIGTNAQGRVTIRGVPREQIMAVRDKLGIKSAIIGKDNAIFPKGTDIEVLKNEFAQKPEAAKPQLDIYSVKDGKHQLLARTTQFGSEAEARDAWIKANNPQKDVEIVVEKTPPEGNARPSNDATYSTFKNGEMIRVAAKGVQPAIFGAKFESQAKEYYEGLKAAPDPKVFAEEWSKKVKAETASSLQSFFGTPDIIKTKDVYGTAIHIKQSDLEAVREGKPVPAEVLADYPDLKQTQAAQPSTKTKQVEPAKRDSHEIAVEKAAKDKIAEIRNAALNIDNKQAARLLNEEADRRESQFIEKYGKDSQEQPIEPTTSPEQQATSILDRANVTGKDRLDIMRDFRDGKHSLEDLEKAYQGKTAEAAISEKPGNLKQAQAEQPASGKSAPIADFGEKIEGARKDLAAAMKKEYSDDDLASLPLSKIWPADLHEKIEDPFIAAIAFAARQELPSKPRVSYKVKNWVEKVKTLRSLATMMLSSETTRARAESLLNESAGLKGFAAKVHLLESLKREQWSRIGEVGEFPNAYRYEPDGEHESKQVPSPTVKVQIDGRTEYYPGAKSVADVIEKVNEKLGVEQQESKMKFEVRGRGDSYFINKAGDSEYRHLKEFTSSKEALDYRNNNYDDLVKAWEAVKERDNVKETDVRGEQNRPRSAQDWRKGKDITTEQFSEAFGFRGGQFGNWVSQGKNIKDRQGMLNGAYDALMDLSDILGVPPKAISLNGELGMSFGARGSGAASAHYESDNLVINLTKTRGAGTLAHEWFHALDNYFQRSRNAPMDHTRETRYITYKPEPRYVNKKYPSTAMTRAELERQRKNDPTAAYLKEENWQLDPNHPQGVRPEVEVKFADLVNALNESPMKKRASLIDKGKSEGYWSRIIERAARSFENYIIAKMAEKGYNNDYLANVVDIANFKRDEGRYPYLKQEELAPIVEAFDNLFATIQTKETDKGTVLYSRISANNDAEYIRKEGLLGGILDRVHEGQLDMNAYFDMRSAPLSEVERFVKENDISPNFSQSSTQVRNPHTISSLKAAINSVFPKTNDFAGLLEATGKFKLILRDEIGKYLGEGAAFSKAQDQTDTPAFRKWFGDSKVVDAEGKPLMVYHGTDSEFNEFKPSKYGSNGPGIYFTTNKRIAEAHGKHVIAAFVKIENDKDGIIAGHEVIVRKPQNIKSATSNNGNFDSSNPDIRYSKDGRILAFVKDGNTYLVADNISSTDDNVKGILLHEIGVHALKLGRNDTEFQSILKQLETMRKMGNRQVVDAFNRVPKDTPAHLVIEEAAGYLVEKSPDLSVSKKIITWFRAQLRKIGQALPVMQRMQWFKWAAKLTPDDIVSMAQQALQSAPQTLAQVKDRGTFKADTQQQFYSQLRKAMRDAPDRVFSTGKQTALWLQGNQSKMGIKKDELYWSGITDWLNTQGKVSKADVLAFLDSNGVQVQDVMLDEENKTKFASFQLPGGENYKELLLTLPEKEAVVEQWAVKAPWGTGRIFESESDAKEHLARQKEDGYSITRLADKPYYSNSFRSSHFDQPNILAHIRFNERIDAEGKRVLFLEEIQSDYAQKGRKEGFSKPKPDTTGFTARKEGAALWNIYDKNGNKVGASNRAWPTAQEAIDDFAEIEAIGGVPSAPFVQDTKSWTALALKRMIAYAAANGFDKVAWTTGEQQSARYDLSKQVDRVEYWPESKILTAYKNGIEVIQKGSVEQSDLPDIVGKEVAKKLIDEPARNGVHQLRGDDLKVGGEGMKGYYDQIVPQVANDILKRLVGGGRIEGVDVGITRPEFQDGKPLISLNPKTSKQLGFALTPEMRAKILNEGLPLFSQKPLDLESQKAYGETANGEQNEQGNAGSSGRISGIYKTVSGLPAVPGFAEETKIRGRNQQPLTVFRGANADLVNEHFDREALGYNSGHAPSGRGVHFTDARETAAGYGNVQKFHLDIRNPFVFKADDESIPDFDTTGEYHAWREGLRRKGYDGIVEIHSHLGGANTIIAFDPHQVIYPSEVRFSRAATLPKTRIIGDAGHPYTPAQRAAMERTGSVVTQKTLNETLQNLWHDAGKKMAQGLFDQFRPIRDLSDYAYTLARLAKGATGAFEAFMQHGKLSIRDGAYDADTSGGVLEKVFFPLGKESTDFLRWIAGNRAERLTKEGKEHLFSSEDIAAFKSLEEGKTDFDYLLPDGTTTRERAEIYKDSLKKFNEFNKNILDMAEQSRLIDGASRHLWEHEFYVPFYRVTEEDGGIRGMNIKSGVIRQEAFKKLKGGEQQLNDLLENTLMNWAHLIDASVQNRAAMATLQAAEKVGAARKALPGEKKTIWYMGEIVRKIPKGQEYEESGVTKVSDGTAEIRTIGKVEYKVDDPYLLEAISSLEYAGLRGPAMDAMSTMKHWLTIGVTASPFFKVRNLIRDSVQAIATSDLSYNPAANVKKGFALTNRESQEYVSALAGGGLIRFGTMLEGSEAKRTRQLIKQGAKDSHILDNENKVRAFYDKYIEPGISAYNELGNRSEEINRMALYDTLIKQGVDHATASLMARDLMDFSMQGTWVSIRFLTQIVPFMNARLQGLYKLGRASQQDKQRFAIVLGAVATASLALLAIYGDDDDWKKREDWDRDNYWWFKFGGEAFRIPKPFEIGAIATLAERSAEFIFDNEMTGDRFKKTLLANMSNQLSMNPVPQLFKPIIDLYANNDSFTNRPIEPMGMEKLSPEYRFKQSTSMVARGISTAGNKLTGENFLSPMQIDHITRAYFGWLGSFVVGSADVIARGLSNEPTKPALDYWKVATGSMVSDLDGAQSRYVSQMYDQARELEEAYGTWRNLRKEGKTAEAKEYREENKDKLVKYRRVENVKQQTSKINERIKIIERSNMDREEKRAKINELRKRQDEIARQLSTP